MRIVNLKTNHMNNPLGFELGTVRLSWQVAESVGKQQKSAQIQVSADAAFRELLFDSGVSAELKSEGTDINIELRPYTRYYWKVTVWSDADECVVSETAWFETAKMGEPFVAKFITAGRDDESSFSYHKKFTVEKEIASARAYVCGLGLYEMYINDEKVGNEYLAPGCNNYDAWIQYQTYDVTEMLKLGGNKILAITGDGWYKGNFGYEGGASCIYGNEQAFLCEVHICYADGEHETIVTNHTWEICDSKIRFSSIYHGEIVDDTFLDTTSYPVNYADVDMSRLKERLSVPVKVMEQKKPIAVIITPAGETVLDMGQNMCGFLSFVCREKKGTQVKLSFGEILQDGNFYRDNMRLARAEFIYTSDGVEKVVRPHFTYFGFRYVKLEGFSADIAPDDFTAQILYSKMQETGWITTGNEKVNQLISNVKWSQKSNFLDVPTDCPQRDERLGWTGDAQVFIKTAAFNMDVYAFMKKYCYDIKTEQLARGGITPMVVPSFHQKDKGCSAWGDAAVIIPWNLYLQYADISILVQNYSTMKAWVDYIRAEEERVHGNRLWFTGFHYGDWLALDTDHPSNPVGKTEIKYIASCYYYISTSIVAKAAKLLDEQDDYKNYADLAKEIKTAIQNEYVTANGRIALETQTAYALGLYAGILPKGKEQRAADDLCARIVEDKGKLTTGFVGTPCLCTMLSKYGHHDVACKLLLNESYPGWLYEVNMGATTIWERWNSVMPDGHMNPDGMNSLNHYAYGSIVGWMYEYLAGFQHDGENAGYKKMTIAPLPYYGLKHIKASYESINGIYKSEWEIMEDGRLSFSFDIPFGASARLVLPDIPKDGIMLNGSAWNEDVLEVDSGHYEVIYQPTKSYLLYYNFDMPLCEMLKNKKIQKIFEEENFCCAYFDEGLMSMIGHMNIHAMRYMPFFHATEEHMQRVEQRICTIRVI